MPQAARNTQRLRRHDVQTDSHTTAGDLYEAVRSGRSALPVRQTHDDQSAVRMDSVLMAVSGRR